MPTATSIRMVDEDGVILEADLEEIQRETLAGTIFDGDQPALPGFEGHTVHRIVVKVAGTIELNPGDAGDVEFFRSLSLGKYVEFRVSGRVISRPHGLKPAKMYVLDPETSVEVERVVDVVTSTAGVKVSWARSMQP